MATNPLTPRVNNIETGGTWKIGDVKQSFLTEVEFQAEHDDTWVLCDGRDVIGSDYAILKEGDAVTSHNIPDARGQFLRGLDTSGTVDPDGAGRSLGNAQGDTMRDHSHQASNLINAYPRGPSTFGGVGIYGAGTTSTTDKTSSPLGPGGDNTWLPVSGENRPKNVAVNMFIKINREPSS